MIVVMDPQAREPLVEEVIAYLVRAGCDVHRSTGQTRMILGVVGRITDNDRAVIEEMDGVARVVAVSEPFRLASRRFRDRQTVLEGDWGKLGDSRAWIAIEPVGERPPPGSEPPPDEPTSTRLPYSVAAGRPFDAAVTRARHAPGSVGSLACLSLHPQPIEPRWPVVFVFRDPSWGHEAWLRAAERELERGTSLVVLVESGGAVPGGARTLDVVSLAKARAATHLPIVVDVPTIAVKSCYCAPVASAAVAAGASGVILRTWVGEPTERPRLPATLDWDSAVDLASRLRSVGDALGS